MQTITGAVFIGDLPAGSWELVTTKRGSVIAIDTTGRNQPRAVYDGRLYPIPATFAQQMLDRRRVGDN